MTAYTTLSNALVGVGAKPFATTIQALRDNPIAIAEGDATAPSLLPAIANKSTAGGVGTYAFAILNSGTVPATGGTTAGSNLTYSSTNSAGGVTLPGTWRLMGYVSGTGLNGRSLWLRIS